eukprot:4738259-Amphidinium_carterae.1
MVLEQVHCNDNGCTLHAEASCKPDHLPPHLQLPPWTRCVIHPVLSCESWAYDLNTHRPQSHNFPHWSQQTALGANLGIS